MPSALGRKVGDNGNYFWERVGGSIAGFPFLNV